MSSYILARSFIILYKILLHKYPVFPCVYIFPYFIRIFTEVTSYLLFHITIVNRDHEQASEVDFANL